MVWKRRTVPVGDRPLSPSSRVRYSKAVSALALELGVVLGTVACADSLARRSEIPSTALIAPGGLSLDARRLASEARWTVFIFFSTHCHCLDAHDLRIRDLYEEFHGRGVEFRMVDSEIGGSNERDDAEARRRGYPFPILIDRGAKFADALGAEYATYSVVVDAEGRVHYRGGIDSDKMRLHEGATPYLRLALSDLVEGRDVHIPEGRTLGCVLERW